MIQLCSHCSGSRWGLAAMRIAHFLFLDFITTRKRSLGQGNMFTGVCLFTGGGQVVADIPPQADTALDRHPPGRHPRADTHPPGRLKHPTGMHSCLHCFYIIFLTKETN